MVFKRLLDSPGVGGPAVDTVLEGAAGGPGGAVLPGGTLRGEVRLVGGDAAYDIEGIALELVARVKTEHQDVESEEYITFGRHEVGGGFRLGEGEERGVPFAVAVPWETPVSELHGEPLGIGLGVWTELEIAGAKDKSDLDLFAVRPLAVQEAVLEGFGQLGFAFKSADLEYGRVNGTGQRLPFYQEIELTPAPRYAHRLSEVEVTFLAYPDGAEIVLEGDKHKGEALNRHAVLHEDVARTDWTAEVASWVELLINQDGPGGGATATATAATATATATAAGAGAGGAGLAVGVAGGMVAVEVVDEVGDFFEGDEEG